MIIVELAGEPRGKGRPRFSRKSGHAYTPAPTRSYEAELKHMAVIAMGGRAPIEGAVRVVVRAFFPVPASWSKKKQAQAINQEIRPTKKPDWENIAKMLDAFNQVVWRDDAQVVSGEITKRYALRPCLRVEVEALP
jgi:Holliday junction resolvase RusA-like endonuclease